MFENILETLGLWFLEAYKLINSELFIIYVLRRGQTPADADFNLLDTARKVEFYGIQLHQAQVNREICREFRCCSVQQNPAMVCF